MSDQIYTWKITIDDGHVAYCYTFCTCRGDVTISNIAKLVRNHLRSLSKLEKELVSKREANEKLEKLQIENADLEKRLADTSGSLVKALFLIADIRRAVGDGIGKLMQDELVAHCGVIYEAYKKEQTK